MTREIADFLYFLWWIMSGADGIGALLAALRLREITRRPGVSIRARRVSTGYGVLLYTLAAEAFLTVAALYFFSDDAQYPVAYIVFRLAGRTIKAGGVWYYVLYVLGIRDGDGTGSAPPPVALHSTEIPAKDLGVK